MQEGRFPFFFNLVVYLYFCFSFLNARFLKLRFFASSYFPYMAQNCRPVNVFEPFGWGRGSTLESCSSWKTGQSVAANAQKKMKKKITNFTSAQIRTVTKCDTAQTRLPLSRRRTHVETSLAMPRERYSKCKQDRTLRVLLGQQGINVSAADSLRNCRAIRIFRH